MQQFHLLTYYKLQSLETGTGDMLIDDIIEATHQDTTRIIDDSNIADEIFYSDNNLKYRYRISIEKERVKTYTKFIHNDF